MREWVGIQWALRLLVVASLVGAVLTAGATGHPPAVAYLVLVVVAALGAGLAPESGFGTFAPALVLGWWLIGPAETGDALHPSVLLASGLLLTAHLAALCAAYGPHDLSLPAPLALLWVRRGLLVLVAAPVSYALAIAARGEPVPTDVWVAGAGVVVAAAVLAGLRLRPTTTAAR